jgi:PAS domain S-box-containing protein
MSKCLLSSAFNKSPQLITISDMATGKYLEVNDNFCTVSGFSREEAVGKTSVELGWISGKERERLVHELKQNGRVIGMELNFRSKNKTRVICRFAVDIVRTTEGDMLFSTAEVITAQKQEEDRVKTILRMAMDGFYLVDMEGRILETNDSYCSMIGYSSEELIKMSVKDVEAVETEEVIKKRIQQIIETGHARFETKHKRKDGRVIDIEASVNYLQEKQPKIFCFIRDITDRKRSEEALLYFQMAVDSATDAIGMATPAGRHYYQNEAYTKLFGLSVSEVDGVSGPPATVYADEKVGRKVFDIIMNGGSFVGEVKMLDKDRKERDIYLRANSIKNNDDKVVGLVGMHTDITDSKLMAEALQARGKQLAESQRIAHIGSWQHNQTTGQVFWSDELFRLFGLDPKKDPADFTMYFNMIHPLDRSALQIAIEEAVRLRKPFSIDYRFIFRDGTTRILHSQGELIQDDTGTQTILSGTCQDITERKRAEDKIQQSEKFIRSILDTVDEGFIVVDRDYRIQTANKAYCKQVGFSDGKIVGQHCYNVSHKTNRPCYEEGEDCSSHRAFETGTPHTTFHRHKDANGNILFVETKAFPIKDSSGAVTSVIETINNITERYLLEEERLKTQKLESIGTLAGGIAHDFNNLLQGVFGYISVAKMTAKNPEKSSAALEQAEKALFQSVNLTTQLLTFSKGGKPTKTLIDLRPVIENSARFILSGSRSDLFLNIFVDLWQAEADGGQLGQVIQNIVLNADQAMPVGGTVRVSAVNIAKNDASLPLGLSFGDYVRIAIQDTGVGIPKQYLSKIFDPYFTTKEKGSGLGLATSYSIVRNHGGMIDVKTKSGIGTTVAIYLPAIAGEVRAVSSEKQQELSQSKKAKILVVDDEEVIRNLSSELLVLLGHDVNVANGGEEALGKYQNAIDAGSPFDIVILDLTIRGGMGGLETVQQLLKMDPQVKAIVSSGYSDDASTANYISRGFKAFLKKPYDVKALNEALNKTLNS